MPEYRNVEAKIDWNEFSGNEVILPICVRSPNVQGRNFTAMLDAVQKKVDSVCLVLCDFLDRHNLGGDADLAMHQSEQWKNKCLPEVYKRFSKVSVYDWLDVMNDPTFKDRHKEIRTLYRDNLTVRNIIDINVDYYVRPKMQRLVNEVGWGFDADELEETSRNYLLEEYAGTPIYKNYSNSRSQVYWGIYIEDTEAFNRYSNIDLSFPITLPVNNNRIGKSVVSIRRETTAQIRVAV